jgi:hypothetical protein
LRFLGRGSSREGCLIAGVSRGYKLCLDYEIYSHR